MTANKKTKTTVLQQQGTKFGQNLSELKKVLIPRTSKRRHSPDNFDFGFMKSRVANTI